VGGEEGIPDIVAADIDATNGPNNERTHYITR